MIGHIGSITPRIHPHRPADGSGDCSQECQIAPLIRRAPRHMGVKRRRTRGDQIILNRDLIKPPPQTDHHTAQPPIAHDQVAAHTHGKNRDIRRKRAQKIRQIIRVRRLKEILRRTAHTQPRQIRQRTVFGQCAARFWDAVHDLLLSLHEICNIHRSTAIKTRVSHS